MAGGRTRPHGGSGGPPISPDYFVVERRLSEGLASGFAPVHGPETSAIRTNGVAHQKTRRTRRIGPPM